MKFSKAYEPNQYEPDIYALWEASGAFAPTTDKDQDQDPYTIVMPPPNANGNLHIGHGLTIALEDILTRYHRLKGNNTWYIPGADHAGFETWVVYEKQLEKAGKSRFDFSRDELYGQVWDFVSEQRGNMELQLRALGASCDWSSLTFTLDPKVIDTVYATFKHMWDDGLIHRGKRLVNYCTKHQTAFADIEVIYEDVKTPLYYMKYGPFVLATTRPETKFGDTAVAVHPDDTRYQEYIGKTITVEGVNGDFTVQVVADEMVDPSFGTGVVKITPAHDFNDWEVKERHNLPVIQVIDQNGRMTEAAGRFKGMTVLEAREAVVAALKEKGLLVKVDNNYKTRVGHCYKCGTVIEPTLMEQWFVKVRPLADRAIQTLEQGSISFHPSSKKKVLINYLHNLKDWNISRQIPWGIPIPLFRNREHPDDWIFDTRVTETEIVKDNKTYIRDEDTLDTWFSSGQWPVITTLTDPQHYPTSVMETGSDLLFPWISRMIMLGTYAANDIPFRDVYMHGMVLDEQGQKMSKSKGNVINPMSVIAEYGSDAFRLGIIASRSAGQNQAFATSKVIAGRNLCNKLWNISRLIQEIVDTAPKPKSSASEITTTHMGEDWICRELTNCSKTLQKLISKYRFAEASELLYDTIWNKYADWFLETQKLYHNLPLLKKTLENILIMLHPFAPFVTETIWQNLSWTNGLLITKKWPSDLTSDPMSAEQFQSIITIVTEIRTHFQSLPGAKKHPVLFGQDSLVDDHQLLIQFLSKAPSVTQTDQPKGLRLAIPNREIYLDISEDIMKEHRKNLETKILEFGRELDTLNLRLSNPNYLAKAPAHLVEESKNQQTEKQALLEKMKQELTLIA
jgi:valyl-tRNA synthetase